MFGGISTFIHSLTTDQFCFFQTSCPEDSWKFPLLLVWWSLVLMLTALSAGFHLYRQTRWLRSTFLQLAKSLQAIRRAPGHSITGAGFEQADTLLRKNPLTRDGWEEFKETVLREEKGETGEKRIFNTRPAAEFFPPAELEQHVSAYHRLMPAALTSLGLLGTFLALLIGLHDVHVHTEKASLSPTIRQTAIEPSSQTEPLSGGQSLSSQPPQVVEGIDKLVNSLSGKFLSSIVALLFSVMYALWEARCVRGVSENHHQFCAAFDGLFVRRTIEELLQKIYRESESQSAAFRHFNTELSGNLKQSFQESLGPTLNRLAEALERMTTNNEERSTELIRSLSETFRSNLTESAQTEFQQLGQSLRQTAGLLQTMNTHGQSTQEGLAALLTRLEESQQQQVSTAEAQRRAMEELFTQVANQVQGVASQSSTNLEQTVSRLLERTATWSNDTAAGVTRVLTDHARVFEERMGTLLARLDTVVSEMGQVTHTGSEQLSSAVGGVVTRLEQAVTTVANTMRGATEGVIQQTGEASTQLSAQIRQVLAQQEQQTRAAHTARESLEQATEQVRSLLQDSAEAFAQIRPLISDLVATTHDLRATGETARNAQAELQQVSSAFAQQGALLQQTTDGQANLLAQFQNVFKTVELGLGSILRQIGEGMQHYQQASRVSLVQHLQEFDNHLATATQQIKVSVEGIGPGLEDLAEAIDSATKQIGSNGRAK